MRLERLRRGEEERHRAVRAKMEEVVGLEGAAGKEAEMLRGMLKEKEEAMARLRTKAVEWDQERETIGTQRQALIDEAKRQAGAVDMEMDAVSALRCPLYDVDGGGDDDVVNMSGGRGETGYARHRADESDGRCGCFLGDGSRPLRFLRASGASSRRGRGSRLSWALPRRVSGTASSSSTRWARMRGTLPLGH